MSTHEEHVRTIDNFSKLIVEHEELKRQYDDLQTNFRLLASKKIDDILKVYAEVVAKRER